MILPQPGPAPDGSRGRPRSRASGSVPVPNGPTRNRRGASADSAGDPMRRAALRGSARSPARSATVTTRRPVSPLRQALTRAGTRRRRRRSWQPRQSPCSTSLDEHCASAASAPGLFRGRAHGRRRARGSSRRGRACAAGRPAPVVAVRTDSAACGRRSGDGLRPRPPGVGIQACLT